MRSDFEKTFYIKGASGSLEPFPVRVSAAKQTGPAEWGCEAQTPMLDKPRMFMSVTPDHAAYCAFLVVRRLLEYEGLTLLEDNGRPAELPMADEPKVT